MAVVTLGSVTSYIGAYVAVVTLGSVTSYIGAYVAVVGGDAILCKQSVPRAERPSYARLPVAFPSVATANTWQL